MNDNARKWVDALRSGEYSQTTGRLRRNVANRYCYCCLGVACELYRQETGEAFWDRGEYFTNTDLAYHDASSTRLVEPVQEWLGLRTHTGLFEGREGRDHLANLNDRGTSFEEIAALIESEPQGLFAR